MTYDPRAVVIAALREAQRIPKTFFPVPIRESATTTQPCFRDRTTGEECSWACASLLMRAVTEQEYLGAILTAYVSACRNPEGSGLTEVLSSGLGEGPLLPPSSLFAPVDDTVVEIITGLGRTLLKLRDQYELVLPRDRPHVREVEHARLILLDHVAYLLKADVERAKNYVERLQKQFAREVEKRSSKRPPTGAPGV